MISTATMIHEVIIVFVISMEPISRMGSAATTM
jgi:hypothetical protein